MEPLFRTETPYTFEEFNTFSNIMYYKVKKMGLKAALVAAGMLLVALLGFFIGEDKLCWIFLIAAPGFLIAMRVRVRSTRKKVWNSAKAMQDIVSYYAFYDDRVTQSNRLGKNEFFYDKLYKIVETPTHFYMMVSENQGMILKKDNCSPELTAFVQALAVKMKGEEK